MTEILLAARSGIIRKVFRQDLPFLLKKTLRFFGIVDVARWKERKCHSDAHVPSNTTADNAELSVLSRSRSICRELCRIALPCGDVISSIAMPMPCHDTAIVAQARNDIATWCGRRRDTPCYKSFAEGLQFLDTRNYVALNSLCYGISTYRVNL